MPYFVKKPIVIEAHQWFKNGDHPQDDVWCPYEDTGKIPTSPREGNIVRYFCNPNIPSDKKCEHCGIEIHKHGWVDTLENGHRVCPGDWIITGVRGERYPCKNDIFKETYEEVV